MAKSDKIRSLLVAFLADDHTIAVYYWSTAKVQEWLMKHKFALPQLHDCDGKRLLELSETNSRRFKDGVDAAEQFRLIALVKTLKGGSKHGITAASGPNSLNSYRTQMYTGDASHQDTHSFGIAGADIGIGDMDKISGRNDLVIGISEGINDQESIKSTQLNDTNRSIMSGGGKGGGKNGVSTHVEMLPLKSFSFSEKMTDDQN